MGLHGFRFPPILRTETAPHLSPPPKKLQRKGPSTSEEDKPSWLDIVFNQVDKVVMDIEM
jgi:hypothetical protein